jgi:hypothetical protein
MVRFLWFWGPKFCEILHLPPPKQSNTCLFKRKKRIPGGETPIPKVMMIAFIISKSSLAPVKKKSQSRFHHTAKHMLASFGSKTAARPMFIF